MLFNQRVLYDHEFDIAQWNVNAPAVCLTEVIPPALHWHLVQTSVICPPEIVQSTGELFLVQSLVRANAVHVWH